MMQITAVVPLNSVLMKRSASEERERERTVDAFLFGLLESLQGGGFDVGQEFTVGDEIIIKRSADKLG